MDPKLIAYLKELTLEAGKYAVELREKGLEIERKADKSPVSNADIHVSNLIYKGIEQLNLGYPIICEEQEIRNVDGAEYFWLVDPIDGTRSYIRNKDTYTVNIALVKHEEPICGFIYQPSKSLLHYTDEQGRLCVELHGNKREPGRRDDETVIAIVSSTTYSKRTAAFIEEHKVDEIIAVPSSIKLAMIAEGEGDVFPKFDPTMEWDIAAGHALINASGGKLTKLDGKDMTYGKPSFDNPNFLATGRNWRQ